MRILNVGTFALNDSQLGTCPNSDYISDTLELLGHHVTRVNESAVTAQDVIALSKDHDWLLCEEGRLRGDHWSDNGKNVIEGYFQDVIDGVSIPVVSWLTNLFMGIGPREVELQTNPIFKADIVFSTDGGHQQEFENLGINHVLLRQGIYEPEAYMGVPDFPTKASVGFIGGVYEEIWPYRKELINRLGDWFGPKFEHFGKSGEIRHDDLNRLCAKLKIVVGDSVYSPQYWSNRIYEIIGRGGFLIHPMIEGLEKDFTPGEHFVSYRYGDWDGLRAKIEYYLSHDEEREAIRVAGFEHCKREHTYEKRVKEMLSILKQKGIV